MFVSLPHKEIKFHTSNTTQNATLKGIVVYTIHVLQQSCQTTLFTFLYERRY